MSGGFTLGELLVVSIVMTGLTLMIAQTWRYLAVDIVELRARARLSQELHIAFESLAEDMGAVVGAAPMGSDGVLLCRDSGKTPNGLADWGEPDIVVQYYLLDGKLIRADQSTGTEIVIAGDVSSFAVENLAGSLLRMVLEVQHSGISRQVTFMWSSP
jgi:hypothetical protein